MMSKKDVKKSLKRIIEGNSGIDTTIWDNNLAQNVAYIIKQLEEQIRHLELKSEGIKVEITGVKPKQIIVDDHWS